MRGLHPLEVISIYHLEVIAALTAVDCSYDPRASNYYLAGLCERTTTALPDALGPIQSWRRDPTVLLLESHAHTSLTPSSCRSITSALALRA
jgi:hypothetical protein